MAKPWSSACLMSRMSACSSRSSIILLSTRNDNSGGIESASATAEAAVNSSGRRVAKPSMPSTTRVRCFDSARPSCRRACGVSAKNAGTNSMVVSHVSKTDAPATTPKSTTMPMRVTTTAKKPMAVDTAVPRQGMARCANAPATASGHGVPVPRRRRASVSRCALSEMPTTKRSTGTMDVSAVSGRPATCRPTSEST